ncbi:MAG: ThuA domain-containing protein [Alphaproteobacteria bacterium]
MSEHPTRLNGHLVIGGASHDFDFVRLELLKLLAAYPHVRVTVAPNFEDLEGLAAADFLIAYTCNVEPGEAAQKALYDFVASGKRWFALHGTNSVLEWSEDGVAAPPRARRFMETLGSQFVAHPAMGPFDVEVTAPDHPLVAGLSAFETVDELYLSDFFGEPEVLLATHYSGEAPGFVRDQWPDNVPRPVLYLKKVGDGEVLYFTLGHRRGHWDAPHRTPYYPEVEEGSWATPEFHEVLRRGIRWAARLDEGEQP